MQANVSITFTVQIQQTGFWGERINKIWHLELIFKRQSRITSLLSYINRYKRILLYTVLRSQTCFQYEHIGKLICLLIHNEKLKHVCTNAMQNFWQSLLPMRGNILHIENLMASWLIQRRKQSRTNYFARLFISVSPSQNASLPQGVCRSHYLYLYL